MSSSVASTPETTAGVPAPDSKNRMSETTEKWMWRLGTFLVVVGVLVVWELLPRLGLVNDIILPPASEVIRAVWELITGETFFGHFRVTLYEMVLGFVIGTLVGLVLGIALGVSKALYKLTYPLVVAFQSIPKIVLAPLLITWLGYGMSSKVAMAVIISFFPVLINTIVGLESVQEEPLKLMRSLRASKWQIFYKLSLPTAAPIMFAGIKTALTFAVIGAIVGEFIGASEGLGYLLHVYSFQLRIDMVFAVIVVLSAIGSILYFLIDWLDRKLIFWRSDTVR
jgi:NitT/TauT family transport system permease protein